MQESINQDLEHISKWIKGSPQNILRSTYQAQRRHDLATVPDRPRRDSLHDAIEAAQAQHPDFEPMYDEDYFEDGGD